MSQSQVPSSQDSFTSELELATFEQLVEGVSWHILDLQKSADNIRRTAHSYRDSYPSRVCLKHAAADLWDILSKMETVEQYMHQQS